jgi:hypothetical protein
LKSWQIAALFASGLAVGGTVVWLITRSSDSDPEARPTTSGIPTSSVTTSTGPGISVNAQRFLERIANSDDKTFHVRYTTSSASGASAVLEIWHTPDKVRRDLVAVSPVNGTAHTTEILDNGKYIRCLKLNATAWQCLSAPTSESGSLGDPLQGNSRDVQDKTVTVTKDVIAGEPVDCYTVPASLAGNSPSIYCLSEDNVPLRIDGGDGKPVEASNFDHDVPASVFDPPAPVAGG